MRREAAAGMSAFRRRAHGLSSRRHAHGPSKHRPGRSGVRELSGATPQNGRRRDVGRRERCSGGRPPGVGSGARECRAAALRVHAVAGRRLQRSGNDACRLSDVMVLYYEIRQQMSCSVLHRNVFLYPGLIWSASERKQGEKRGPFGAFYSEMRFYEKINKILQ